MKVKFYKNELKTIRASLCGTKQILEEAAFIALKNITDNPQKYFQYSDYLTRINLLIEKIEGYLNEHTDKGNEAPKTMF